MSGDCSVDVLVNLERTRSIFYILGFTDIGSDSGGKVIIIWIKAL